jgi:hypothetical protein
MNDLRDMHRPTVPELLRWLANHTHVWYLAPMDTRPVPVYRRGKIKTWARDPKRFAFTVEAPSLRFRIDEGHLSRIYIPNNTWQKEQIDSVAERLAESVRNGPTS